MPGDKKVSIVELEAADYPGFIAEQVKTGKIGIDEVEGFLMKVIHLSLERKQV